MANRIPTQMTREKVLNFSWSDLYNTYVVFLVDGNVNDGG